MLFRNVNAVVRIWCVGWVPDVQVKDLSEVALEEALVKLLSQSQRSSMSCEEQALSDKMLETVFEPGRPGVGLIKDCEVMSSHYEALRYTMDCIVITLKRQGLSSEDKVDPEEVTQVIDFTGINAHARAYKFASIYCLQQKQIHLLV